MGAGKDIDFPDETFIRDAVTRLFDDDTDGVFQQFLGVGDGDLILEFVAGERAAADLHRQPRGLPIKDANTHRAVIHGGDVALFQDRFGLCGRAPCFATYEELPFDLFRHTNEPFVTITAR